jgi:flagellar basal-body rod modification protein FlgD
MPTVADVRNGALDLTRGATTSAPTGALDKDTFLKLLTAQMRYQDPLKPTDQTAQLAQLAQFSSLEQMTNLVRETQSLANATKVDQAIALVGKQVTYKNADDQVVTGTVEKVTFNEGKPELTISGVKNVDPASITEVG